MRKFPKPDGNVTVVFELPAGTGASTASILGDFTAWVPLDMSPSAEGGFELSIDLAAGASYRFRYLIDGNRWENDWAADGYEPNTFGGDDSVVEV